MAGRTIGFVTSAVVALLFGTSASAQEMRWQQREGEGRVFLAYEVPESSDQSLVLTCDTRSRRFTIDYYDDRDRARDGTRAEVAFGSEGGKISLPMRAKQLELGEQIVLQAETALTPDWVRLLSGKTLRVTLSGDTQSIPLAGTQKGLSALTAGCSPR